MKPIAIDEFMNLKFLSEVTFSPEGRSACLVVTEIDRKKDEYRSCLWLRRDGKLRKLTSFGKERSFQYLDEDTILFPGRRRALARRYFLYGFFSSSRLPPSSPPNIS